MQEKTIYNEDDFIIGCSEGNRRIQYALYEKFAPRMYAVAMRYSKTTLEADDILQEAFIKIFEHIGEFKKECPLEFWIKRVVINTALKHNRRKIDRAPKEEVSDLNYWSEQETVVSNFNFEELLGFVRRLADGYQLIFNLYAIEGFKHKEIAEMLGISEGTSKSQYARAKAILQEMIAKENEEYEQTR